MQIEKANPNMGFGGPNMALANMGFKDQKLVSVWRGGNSRERESEEEEEEEEKKKKMKGRSSSKAKLRYGN